MSHIEDDMNLPLNTHVCRTANSLGLVAFISFGHQNATNLTFMVKAVEKTFVHIKVMHRADPQSPIDCYYDSLCTITVIELYG